MDKGLISYMDDEIGSTVIDLEDRLYSNPKYMSEYTLQFKRERKEELKRAEEKKKGKKKKFRNYKLEKLLKR